MVDNKGLPNDLFSEQTVLGLMLMDDKIATDILSQLHEEDFYAGNFANVQIFRAMRRAKDQGLPVDITTVTSELTNMKQLDAIGGVSHLVYLTESVVTTANYEYYINNLRDNTLLRKLITAVDEIKYDYENKDIKNINDFINQADAKITDITRNRRVTGFRKADDIANEVTAQILARRGNDADTLKGITSGYGCLDRLTSGFKKGELIYLAARPSVGKTALGLNMCYNAALNSRKPVGIFELEMRSETLFERILASRSNVPLDHIQKGFLNNDERLKIQEASREIAQVPLYIDDNSGSTIDDIITKTRKLKNENPDLALIMVDYIGIISDSKYMNKNDSRQNVVSSYSRKLKELASELNIAVLCLSQLTRKVDERDDKKPQLSDLRESGSLEQDADQVILIYRPAYYTDQGISITGPQKKFGKDSEPQKEEQPEVRSQSGGDLVSLILAKNRNGAIGTTNLLFFKPVGLFNALTDDMTQSLKHFPGV